MNQMNTKIMISHFQKRRRKSLMIFIFFIFFLIFLCIASLMIGHTNYSLAELLKIMSGENMAGSFTILTLRLPRMLTGLLCGFAFGIAGNTFQKFLGNPLASPDIIGVSAGSSAVAVFCILILHMSGLFVSLSALLGGLLIAGLIYHFSKDENFSNGKLILIGIGFQAFLNAIISYLLLKAPQYDLSYALRWLNGSLNGASLDNITGLLCVIMIVTSILIFFDRHISIMELGQDFATILGIKIKELRKILIFCAVLLIAFATSLSGPIASVAFLSGPIAHKIDKTSHSHMLLSGLVGAILVLLADFTAMNILSTRYPVGVVTGILGAPYLIFLLIRMNQKGETTI